MMWKQFKILEPERSPWFTALMSLQNVSKDYVCKQIQSDVDIIQCGRNYKFYGRGGGVSDDTVFLFIILDLF